jgi:hypothetical protein
MDIQPVRHGVDSLVGQMTIFITGVRSDLYGARSQGALSQTRTELSAFIFWKHSQILQIILYKYTLCKRFAVSTYFVTQIMPCLPNLCYNGGLVTWTIVNLTAATYKPLMLPVNSFVCHMFRTFACSWICMTAATCCLHNIVMKA